MSGQIWAVICTDAHSVPSSVCSNGACPPIHPVHGHWSWRASVRFPPGAPFFSRVYPRPAKTPMDSHWHQLVELGVENAGRATKASPPVRRLDAVIRRGPDGSSAGAGSPHGDEQTVSSLENWSSLKLRRRVML